MPNPDRRIVKNIGPNFVYKLNFPYKILGMVPYPLFSKSAKELSYLLVGKNSQGRGSDEREGL